MENEVCASCGILAGKLSSQEVLALSHARILGGRNWKQKLRDAWMMHDYRLYSPNCLTDLANLRNASYFGPSGLIRFHSHRGVSQ